ncbi:MAG TPA: hypothetical protein VMA74_16935 [Dyella sp.]|uniref:hypothetical protein n=1 Tax=Dyella sp. TaxID=1869338 RepID=UPI002D16C7A1|nr:hypothetical protein [Dyella sp.]HUB91411.1 hypothetical protein [Dyella sp.]
MATGDNQDFFSRLKGLLPSRWFGSPTDSVPFIDAVLTGIGNALSFIYALYGFAKLQTRILNATDGWIDLISADFFGTSLPRQTGETDDSFRARILANLFREKATRHAIIQTLTQLTGRTPIIIEPTRPGDCGGYGAPNCGYGVAGYYGSLQLPYQAFVIAFRPFSAQGVAGMPGYGDPEGGYGVASGYTSLSLITAGVSDAAIFAAVDAVKPAGTIAWVRIAS